jgi:hypothetical protein
MKVDTFKKRAETLISKLETLISKMPDKGLKSEDSQKLCLLQALNEFSYCVNGTEQEDFKK